MATYIALVDFTADGIHNIQDTTGRSEDFEADARRLGVEVLHTYWTIGAHDGVLVLEAPNDEVAASVFLALGARGNVRTTTLRAFEWADAQGLIENEA